MFARPSLEDLELALFLEAEALQLTAATAGEGAGVVLEVGPSECWVYEGCMRGVRGVYEGYMRGV